MRPRAMILISLGVIVALTQLTAACGSATMTQIVNTDAGDAAPQNVIVSGLTDPISMASDGSTIFIAQGDGVLSSVPATGGIPTTLVANGLTTAHRFVAVDVNNVYFTRDDGVYSLPKSGGIPTRLSEGPADTYVATMSPFGLLWAEVHGGAGGNATIRTTAGVVAAFDLRLPIVAMSATSKSAIFWGFGVSRVPLDGSATGGAPPEELLTQTNCNQALLTDEHSAYCFPNSRGPVVRFDEDSNTTSFLTTEVEAFAVTMDSDTLYWSERQGTSGKVSRMSKAGGTVVTIDDHLASVIAVDDHAIYVERVGAIRRIAK